MNKILILCAAFATQPICTAETKSFLSTAKTHFQSKDKKYYSKASIGVIGTCVCAVLTYKGIAALYDHFRRKSVLQKAGKKVRLLFKQRAAWTSYLATLLLFIASAIITCKMALSTKQECVIIWEESKRKSFEESQPMWNKNSGVDDDGDEHWD